MKRIGVFTISWDFLSSNYGTFFQHWALRKTLKAMGCIPFRIVYDERPHTAISWLKGIIRAFLAIPWHVFRWGKTWQGEFSQWVYRSRCSFKFQRDYRKLIEPADELRCGIHCDAIVGGSDQMWNTGFFKNVNCPTITYAASSDWLKASKNRPLLQLMEEKKSLIKDVSIREKAGIEWLKHIGYRAEDLFHAIDPVFHWNSEDYLALTSKKKILKRPTLLCYFVNVRSKDEFSLEYWERVAYQLGVDLKIIGIQGLENYLPLPMRSVPSPRDFLRYYRDAKYIVTNSFHGTVFALTMGKPFVCLNQRELPGASQNVRCNELLDWLNLKSHYLPYDALETEVMNTLNVPIDYTIVHQEIARRRAESKAWLEQALRTCAAVDC